MNDVAISIEHLYKQYRLGLINHGMLYRDIQSWWARIRRNPDPNAKIMESNKRQVNTDKFWALDDISVEIQNGDIIGIIGKNGAGKSTLLKILSRITAPTQGIVKIKGRISSLLEVGTGFHPELTGRENVYLNGAILGMTKKEITKVFDEIIAFAEIEQFVDTPVKRYSSGMYVRLAFAVASFLEPEILVIDEVLAVGDVTFQKKCLGKMEDIGKGGRTILFVSHNMAAVSRLCKTAMLLEDGKCILQGKVDEVINKYIKKDSTTVISYRELCNAPRYDKNPKKIITWISLHKDDGSETTDFHTGESIHIRIGFSVENSLTAYCQINFLNYLGDRVIAIHNKHSGAQLQISGNGYIECSLHDVRLLSGEYSIMLDFGRIFPVTEWLDCIPEAIRFRVDTGNYLGGTDWTNSAGHGAMAQKSSWRLVETY